MFAVSFPGCDHSSVRASDLRRRDRLRQRSGEDSAQPDQHPRCARYKSKSHRGRHAHAERGQSGSFCRLGTLTFRSDECLEVEGRRRTASLAFDQCRPERLQASFTLFKQPEAGTYDLTRGGITPLLDLLVNELCKMLADAYRCIFAHALVYQKLVFTIRLRSH